MKPLAKNFPHAEAEQHWYAHWNAQGYFHSVPDDRQPYTIVMPPPNVTGVLHMGHALNNTVQDVLIRRHKALGFNTCWVPGTDHASIATEAKVVGMLRERGIDKNKLSREEFLGYAWEWKEKYGGIILEQLKKLGCALDWDRTHFTMDDAYYKAVIRTFVELYNKGLIYRGVKMINWDPRAKTALSDEEVIFKTTQSKLVYIRYELCDAEGNTDADASGSGGAITIATVRPETILGDTAICVHPDDARYKDLQGRYCLVPLINRVIPIITDGYIDPEFGTGALKVTPAHDINDYNIGRKHNLPVIDTLNEDGTMSEAAQLYVGEDRFVVRKKITEALREAGHLAKEEDYQNQVGHSERSDAVIEPRLSMQWWCKMEGIGKPALEAVESDVVRFFPPKYKNLYRHWMENIRDWCISRQLWWGQRIPAWYDEQGNIYVAETEEEALEQVKSQKSKVKTGSNDSPTTLQQSSNNPPTLRQDADVLDTWFSSWLWPLEVFNWNAAPDNADLAYYYPTATLVTAPEIIFFWVARMIMAGYEFKGGLPFERVYFTGIVRDKQGRKMSKSLGNSPDLLKLIDDWGADAVRFSVMISSPAGNDLLYDESQLEQGRNFCNKMWNAARLIQLWQEKAGNQTNATGADGNPVGTRLAAARSGTDDSASQQVNGSTDFPTRWMHARIDEASKELETLFAQFRLSEALKQLYSLIWDDFCSWYLEWMKPAQDAVLSPAQLADVTGIYDRLLQLLHPFLPFVTEELYHAIAERNEGDDLISKPLATPAGADDSLLREGDWLKTTISALRDARARNNIKPREAATLGYAGGNDTLFTRHGDLLMRQASLQAIAAVSAPEQGAIAIVAGTDKLYLKTEAPVLDTAQQRAALEKERTYLQGFVASVDKKLGNEKFVANAKPEVVESERKKKADAEGKIKSLEESIALL